MNKTDSINEHTLSDNLIFSSPTRVNKFQIQKLYKNNKGFTVLQRYSYREISDKQRFKKLHKYTETTLKGTEPVKKSKSELIILSPNSQPNQLEKYMSDVHSDDVNEDNMKIRNKIPRLLIHPKSDSIFSTRNHKNKSSMCKLIEILILVFVPIILGLFFIMCFSNPGFVVQLDSTNITHALRHSLYGQNEIIDKLKYNFDLIQNNKVFLFFGTVGVGKTYTSQIIERHFPFQNNIQKYISTETNHEQLKDNIINNLKPNEDNLIIIDDVSSKNLYSILPIISNLSSSGTRFILIIIFNDLNDDFSDFTTYHNIKFKANDISKIFSANNIDHSLYVFKNIEVNDAKKCIKDALIKRGKYKNNDDIDKVLQNIDYERNGCKGVHAKSALINHDV